MRLYGKNPVLERIRSDPDSIRKLYLQKKKDLSEIVREAKKAGITFESADKTQLARLGRDAHTQGVVAEVEDFKYAPFSKILSECLESGTIPVFLDRVTDPQNLGSIIRSLACLGGFSIILPEHESVHVNETVLRVANGGENYIRIAKVTNTVGALKQVKEKDIQVVGATVEGGSDMLKTDLAFPMAVVIGSEGKGLRPGVLKLVDTALHLPMKGAALSFNVAVAASLFCYEISRRKA